MSLLPRFQPIRFEGGYPGLGVARKAVSKILKKEVVKGTKKVKKKRRKVKRSGKFLR